MMKIFQYHNFFLRKFDVLGSIFVNGVAWAVLGAENLTWRYLVAFCSIPVFVALSFFQLLPESPHWLLSKGRSDEALAIIRKAASYNGRADFLPANARLVTHLDSTVTHASSFGIFGPHLRRTTLSLFTVWACFGFTYYGTVLIMPTVLPVVPTNTSDSTEQLSFNFPALFVACSAELVGCVIATILIDRVGRQRLSVVCYVICSVFTALLTMETAIWLRLLFVVSARAALFIASCLTWVITPELYPTAQRAAAHSWANAISRVGAFCTAYWGDAAGISLPIKLSLYAFMNLVAAVATNILPVEGTSRLKD